MAGNARSGRKPKAAALHALHGTSPRLGLSAPVDNVDASDQNAIDWALVDGIPKPPPGLNAVASAKWTALVKPLHKLGLLTELDGDTLAVYCHNYALWCQAVDALETWGLMVKTPNGYPQKSPWLSIKKDAEEAMKAVQSNFGFSPAARTKPLHSTKKRTTSAQLDPTAQFTQSLVHEFALN